MAGSLTATLATFAAGLKLADVPEDVRDKIALHLIDALGCGLSGARSQVARTVLATTLLEQGQGPCPVFGSDRMLGPAAAAFANAAAINGFDFDDGLEVEGRGLGHPGATLVAAALSGEAISGANDDEVLAALVAAYEVNARLILAIQPSIGRFREVYGVGQHQALGAAIAYGRLVGLDAAGLSMALGHAGTLAPLPSLRKYNWERRPLVSFKDFVAPAAEVGVRAVQFTQAGLIGAHDVLDGPLGFWRMIGSDQFAPHYLTEGLGETWWCRHASFKLYPACRWIHTALESFETVIREYRLAPGDIDEVVVCTSRGIARDFMDVAPEGEVDAQFSLPFCLARLAGGVDPAEWHISTDLAPDHRALAGRVRAEVDEEIDAAMSGPQRRPAGQVIVVAGGRRIEGPRLAYPLGTREQSVDPSRIEAKYRAHIASASAS